jgi:hypothetical protein
VTALDMLKAYCDAHPMDTVELVAAIWAAEAALMRLNEATEPLGDTLRRLGLDDEAPS